MSKHDIEIETKLFAQLREIERNQYQHLLDRKAIKGNANRWIKNDVKRKILKRYLASGVYSKINKLEQTALSLRQEIVKINMGLISLRAKRFYSTFLEYSELVQEGVLGILDAINRFDTERGYRFSTYAQYWIDVRIRRAVYANDTLVRHPERHRVRTEKFVVVPIENMDASRCAVSQGDHAMIDWDKLAGALETLPQRDQHILMQRYGDDKNTLREIGERWGVSRERIRQRQNESFRVLREKLGLTG